VTTPTPTWAALLRPYTLDATLTPLPGAAAPPSERTRRRLAADGAAGAEWADVLLGVGEGWETTTDGEER